MTESPLLGREPEWERLRTRLEAVRDGTASSCAIEGEAGIGKTRLLDEALSYAHRRGYAVLRGAAAELEATRPVGPLVDALDLRPDHPDPDRVAVAGLLAADDAAGLRDLRYRLVDGILSVLERLAADRPTVMAVDDLHWADPTTVRVLDAALRRLASVPLVVLVTLRPTPRPPEVESFLGTAVARSCEYVRLGPLDEPSVVSILAATIGADPGPRLRRQVSRTGGNPLFVTELAKALVDEGRVHTSEGRAEVGDELLPPSLRTTVLRRLSALAPHTIQVAKAATLLGTEFTVAELGLVLGRNAVEFAPAIDEMCRAGLLDEAGEHLRWHHDLLREAIYHDTPESVRRAIHLDAGRAMAAAGAPAERVAWHLGRGASAADPDAAKWLRRAASEVVQKSPSQAAGLLRRAIELGSDAAAGDQMAVELVAALVADGRFAEAVECSHEFLSRVTDSEVCAAIRRGAARAHLLRGQLDEATRELETASSYPGLPPNLVAALWAEASLGHLLTGDLHGAEEVANRALGEAERLGDELTARTALCTLSWVANAGGEVARGVDLAARATQVADRSDDAGRHEPYVFLGTVLIGMDRLDEAEAAVRTGMRLGEEAGSLWHLALYHSVLCMKHYVAGEWDDALAEAETGYAYGEEFGTRMGAVWQQSLTAHIAIHRGRHGDARAALDGAERVLTEGSLVNASGVDFGIDWMLWARGLLELKDDPERGLATLAGTWDAYTSAGAMHFCPMEVDLVRAAVAQGDLERAARVTEMRELVARLSPASSLLAQALHCRGLLERDGDTLRRAVEQYRRAPRPLELAEACVDAARLDPDATLLDEAASIFDRLGAVHDAARMAVVAGRRARGRAQRRPESGWESLTETERRVVRLVTDGLTNRRIGEWLFISPRTVETHLKHVFQKLGLSSRVALAASASSRRNL